MKPFWVLGERASRLELKLTQLGQHLWEARETKTAPELEREGHVITTPVLLIFLQVDGILELPVQYLLQLGHLGEDGFLLFL